MKNKSPTVLTISAPIPQPPHPYREKVHFAGSPPPYTAKSRSSSTASSTSSSPSPQPDLHAIALHLLDTLYNRHDLAAARPLIHPDMTASHNDDATLRSRDEYLAYWARRTKRVPDLRARCRECAVDEGQRKVWVVSELYSGAEGAGVDGAAAAAGAVPARPRATRRKESVDMLWFDEDGRLVGGSDWVRSVKLREDDD